MSPESWQNACPRCGWANSGAERRCMKCGQRLRTSPGLLVAGQSASSAISPSSHSKPRRVVQPGGFFPRLIAIIIDALILGVVTVPFVYLFLAQATPTRVTPTGQSNAFLDQLKGLQLTQLAQLLVGIAILQLFYYVATWSILGGSPGQLVMSLRIVDGSAKTVGFGRALLRYFMKGFFAWLSPVSVLMVAFGKDKRAIHDFLAGTFVIQFLDPRLEDFDSVLPPAQSSLLAPQATTPQVTSQVPQELYAGAALAAAAVSGPASAAPDPAAAPPSQPLPPAPSGGGAPIPPAAPVAPPPARPVAPAAPDPSAFESYSVPGVLPPPAAMPTPAPAPNLPVFPTSDAGGYQAMAPAPPAPVPLRPAPATPVPATPSAPVVSGPSATDHQALTPPYALPFTPPDPPTPEPTPQPGPPADAQP